MQNLNIQRYTHIPLFVEGVQITEENMEAVSAWCEGKMCKSGKGKWFIKVATIRPLRDRQTQGFVGDWVLKTSLGLKLYTDEAFKRAFVLAPKA